MIDDHNHPQYAAKANDYRKYRLTYDGGKEFVRRYLKKFTNEEKTADFNRRIDLAYAPGHAAAAINEIKDAIFQRIYDVERTNKTPSYVSAVNGDQGGVDLAGSTMNAYIGEKILPDLLVTSKIGVLVDRDEAIGETLADEVGNPYLIYFRAENILNWYPNDPVNGYETILLRERFETFNDYGLYTGDEDKYRLYTKKQGYVQVDFFDSAFTKVETKTLNIPEIPFHIFEIQNSLMKRVADKEIALMNIESSDLMFCLVSNYPMFYEQYSAVSEGIINEMKKEFGTETNEDTAVGEFGLSKGKRYPKDVSMTPGFISPDPNVLRVSMEKATQIKEDIRLSVNLNLLSMNPRRSSAESKKMDLSTLEASLSYIGLVIEKGETQIAKFWNYFENKTTNPKVTYPLTYDLRSEDDRRIEAESLITLRSKLQSKTYKKEMTKRIISILLSRRVEDDVIEQIYSEVDEQEFFAPEPEWILKAIEHNAITRNTGAEALGFSKKEGEAAKAERIESAKLIAESQGGQVGKERGTPEFENIETEGEKDGKKKRGEAK